MILTVSRVRSLSGRVNLPASKSYTIRSFIIASLGGTSKIIKPSCCDDAIVSMRVAKNLGAQITAVNKDTFQLIALKKKSRISEINIGESGTALRFLLPLVALKGYRVTIIGEGTIKTRPNFHLAEVLRNMGKEISGRGKKDCVPILIKNGRLRGGRVEIDGSLSSQFISALLIACPCLEEDTELVVKGKKIVSETYITMTRQVLKKAGIKVEKISPRVFFIKGKQIYKGLHNFRVPSDYGLAAFFMAAAALSQSTIVLKGYWDHKLIQADAAIIPLLEEMGVIFKKTSRAITIKGPFSLKGGSFSLKDCPDLLPILSIVALFAKGKTRFNHIGHVRIKESDRISDLRKELLKVGAKITETKNSITIFPQDIYNQNCLLDPHQDHRLAMAFCVLGLKLGVRVKDIECVSKSYPQFVRDFRNIGAKVSKNEKFV